MQNKNHWYRNFRFKLFAVLCAIAVLASAVFVNRPVLARQDAVNPAHPAAASAGNQNHHISVISRGPGLLDIFIQRASLYMKSFNGSAWSSWINLGAPPSGGQWSTVSAVASGNNRMDLFAASGNTVYHKAFDGTAFGPWESLGAGGLAGAGIQALSTSGGGLYVFSTTTSSSASTGLLVYKRWTSATGWVPGQTTWYTLDSSTAGATVYPLAHSSNHIDIFRRLDSNQSINRKPMNSDTGQASGWASMSGGITLDTPTAVTWGPNRVDAFVRGTDGNIWIDSSGDAGTTWSGWNSLGVGSSTTSTTSPSAVSWVSGRLDVFETNGIIYHKAWTGSAWTAWENLGDSTVGYPSNQYPPVAVSWGPSRIDLFMYSDGNNRVSHKWTDGAGWGPSQTGWENLGSP